MRDKYPTVRTLNLFILVEKKMSSAKYNLYNSTLAKATVQFLNKPCEFLSKLFRDPVNF